LLINILSPIHNYYHHLTIITERQMATHFARGTLSTDQIISSRLSADTLEQAQQLPEHRRQRFLASRSLLAEMMFRFFGIKTLPAIHTTPKGKPRFSDSELADFSIAYAGNMVGIALTTEGCCGLDMALQRTTRGFTHPNTGDQAFPFTSTESTWISNQHDATEAKTQLVTLRHSLLKMTGEKDETSDTVQLQPAAGKLRVMNCPQVEAFCDAEDVLIWSVAVSPAIDKLTLWQYHNQSWKYLPDMATRRNDEASRLMRFTSLPCEKAHILNVSHSETSGSHHV